MTDVRVAGVFVILFGLVPQFSVEACQICLPFPKKSVADYLLEADAVVLAREDPEKPFSLRAVEFLKGEMDEKGIDLFVDSTSRRILSLYPDRKIVCVYREEGEAKAGWRRIGMTDVNVEPVVRKILGSAKAWEESPDARVDYFAQFLGHEAEQLRALAHLEVARAPYGKIRQLGGVLSSEEIRAFLNNIRNVEWQALYILLLAQSEAEEDRERILMSFRSAEEIGLTLQLAAWATAFVEIDEEEAIEFIAARYLRNANRKPEEIRAVLAALSVHGTNGHTHLRDRIVEGYRALLETYPELATVVVDDLMRWERWDFADEIDQISKAKLEGVDMQGTLKLRTYARDARAAALERGSAAESGEEVGGEIPEAWWLIGGAGLILLSIVLGARGKRRKSAPSRS